MRCVLLPTGRLQFLSEGSNPIFSVIFGVHFAEWKYHEPKDISLRVSEEGTVVSHALIGNEKDGVVQVETKVSWIDSGEEGKQGFFRYQMVATPQQRICGVCSYGAHIFLPSEHFEGGLISFASQFQLPFPGSKPLENLSPFPNPHIHSDLASGFLLSTVSGHVSFRISVEGSPTRVVFKDIREWTPSLEVVVGDQAHSPFDWSEPLSVTLAFHPVNVEMSPSSLINLSQARNLTQEQTTFFKENGFVTVENVISQEMISSALSLINHTIGKNGGGKEAVAGLSTHNTLTQIFQYSPLVSFARQLLGVDGVPSWSGAGVQVALVYPLHPHPPIPQVHHFHIDGIPTDDNGLEKEKLHPFTLLIGVYLSDLPAENHGNLIVYPGSHLKHAAHFEKNSPLCLLKDMPLKFNNPHQICVTAGSIILCHYLTAHSVALNLSPNIRYALYFRVSANSFLARKSDRGTDVSFSNLWLDWKI